MFRVLSFAGRNTDEFDALEGRGDNAHGCQHTAPAIGHESAVVPEIADTDRNAAIAEAKEDDRSPDDEHDDDSDDFNQGEPKFKFTVVFDGCHISRCDDGHAGQGRDPLRQQWEPVVDVNADSCDFRQTDDDPQEPIGAGSEVADERTDIFMSIRGKGAGNGFLIKHFPHDAHDEKHDDARHGITEQYRRSRHLDGVGRPHEQADTNRPPKSDHLYVARFQAAFHFLLFHDLPSITSR